MIILLDARHRIETDRWQWIIARHDGTRWEHKLFFRQAKFLLKELNEQGLAPHQNGLRYFLRKMQEAEDALEATPHVTMDEGEIAFINKRHEILYLSYLKQGEYVLRVRRPSGSADAEGFYRTAGQALSGFFKLAVFESEGEFGPTTGPSTFWGRNAALSALQCRLWLERRGQAPLEAAGSAVTDENAPDMDP